MTPTLEEDDLPAVYRCTLPVSNHFPPVVRDALVAASRTYCVDPMDRVKAINHATARARLLYPELFIH